MTKSNGTTRAGALTSLFAVAALSAACQGTLSMEKTQDAIRTGLAEQLEEPIASVTCPDSTRPIRQGDTFECKAAVQSGGELSIKVTQEDDQGNIEWELTDGNRLVSLDALEQNIRQGLADQLQVDATVDCGGKYRVSVPGGTFECVATAGGESRQVVVNVKDAQGNVNWALK